DPAGSAEMRDWTSLETSDSDAEEAEPEIRRRSEHGLGHLLNPTDPDSEDRAWARQAWEYVRALESDPDASGPDGIDPPAGRRPLPPPDPPPLLPTPPTGGRPRRGFSQAVHLPHRRLRRALGAPGSRGAHRPRRSVRSRPPPMADDALVQPLRRHAIPR